LRRTLYRDLSLVDAGDLDAEYRQLEDEGADFLSAEGVPAEHVSFERTADLRYAGQEYSLTVPVALSPNGPRGPIDVPGVRQLFDRLYMERYGHSNPAAPAELVKLGVTATGRVGRPATAAPLSEARGDWDRRAVLFAGQGHDCLIVPREQLGPGDEVRGGAIIEEATATTVVPPGWVLNVIEGGHLVIRRQQS
jgi:N-methylhydantoinase A